MEVEKEKWWRWLDDGVLLGSLVALLLIGIGIYVKGMLRLIEQEQTQEERSQELP